LRNSDFQRFFCSDLFEILLNYAIVKSEIQKEDFGHAEFQICGNAKSRECDPAGIYVWEKEGGGNWF
jgi:hypothetical protein